MAEMVIEIAAHRFPGQRVALMGHNFHVSKAAVIENFQPMGQYLAESLQDKYVSIGQAASVTAHKRVGQEHIATVYSDSGEHGFESELERHNVTAMWMDSAVAEIAQSNQRTLMFAYPATREVRAADHFDGVLYLRYSQAGALYGRTPY